MPDQLVHLRKFRGSLSHMCANARTWSPGPARPLATGSNMTISAIVFSVPQACALACIGRTALYEAIKSGALRAVKRGRRTLILDEDLRRWVRELPPLQARKIVVAGGP